MGDGVRVMAEGGVVVVARAGCETIKVRMTPEYARKLAARLLCVTDAQETLPCPEARAEIGRRLRRLVSWGGRKAEDN